MNRSRGIPICLSWAAHRSALECATIHSNAYIPIRGIHSWLCFVYLYPRTSVPVPPRQSILSLVSIHPSVYPSPSGSLTRELSQCSRSNALVTAKTRQLALSKNPIRKGTIQWSSFCYAMNSILSETSSRQKVLKVERVGEWAEYSFPFPSSTKPTRENG